MSAGKPRIAVFGAGLAGPLMACYLGRAGHRVDLYDMRPDPRRESASPGRSINLALSVRGIHALQEVGVYDKVRELCLPMRGRMMHGVDGAQVFQPYGTEEGQFLYSVSRGLLNERLLDAAEALPEVSLHFQHKCTDLDLDTNIAEFIDLRHGSDLRVHADVIVGADGAFSRVRAALQRRDRFDYSQDYLEYGYKELSLAATADGKHRIDPGALHIWPRSTTMMIALPNLDGTFTCTLFWPFRGPLGFEATQSPEEVMRRFETRYPDVVPLMPDLVDQYRDNPVGSLVTVRCRPWRAEGRAVLIGDACHAVVPFYGQGMNAAFEDCTVLNGCLERHGRDFAAAFSEYETLRKENADALADLALENFVEMRDKVGNRTFLLRKRGERLLHRLFPKWFLPLYSMVTFSRIPYAEARRRARTQERAVMTVLAVLGFLILLACFIAIS